MKKGSLLVLMILFVLSMFSGCSKKDDDIVDMVKDAEMLTHKLSTYGISYDEYMKEMKNYFSSEYTEGRLFNRVIPGAIMNLHNKEEIDYKSYYENERKLRYDIKEYEITTKISKVYDLKNDVKNVFVKTEMELNEKNEIDDINIVLTKKYVITKENNEWKISKDYLDVYKKEKPKRLNYTVFNSSEYVEYITSFTVSNKNK